MQRPRKSELAEKLAAQVMLPGRRSQLYNWLRGHYAELSEARRQVRSTWEDLAAIVVDAGVKGARGQEPTAEVVRKAWQAVTRDLKPAEGTPAEPASDAPPRPRRKAAKGDQSAPDDDSGDLPPRHTFTPARIK